MRKHGTSEKENVCLYMATRDLGNRLFQSAGLTNNWHEISATATGLSRDLIAPEGRVSHVSPSSMKLQVSC